MLLSFASGFALLPGLSMLFLAVYTVLAREREHMDRSFGIGEGVCGSRVRARRLRRLASVRDRVRLG